MSRICPLFSGSTGNCTYIGTSAGSILVDAGVSMKRICAEIEKCGGNFTDINAVVVTHEHSDHVKGLKTFLNKTGADLIASYDTLNALKKLDLIPAKTSVLEIDDESQIQINGITVKRFPTSHDCKGSSGYTFNLPDYKSVAICTDLGIVTDKVRNKLKGKDLVLIESNHDIQMLKSGPYPAVLKMRIMSETGHISNNACASELPELFKSGTKRFILGHLSLKNNSILLAKSCSEAALLDIGAENGKDYILKVASYENNGVTVI